MTQDLQLKPNIFSWRKMTLAAASAAALICAPVHATPVALTDASLEEVTAGSSAGAGIAKAMAAAFGKYNSSRTNTDVVVTADGKRTSVTSHQTANAIGTDGAVAGGGVHVTAGTVSSQTTGAAASLSGTANVSSNGRATSARNGSFSISRTTAIATGPGAAATTTGASSVTGSGMSITATSTRQLGNAVISRTISMAYGT